MTSKNPRIPNSYDQRCTRAAKLLARWRTDGPASKFQDRLEEGIASLREGGRGATAECVLSLVDLGESPLEWPGTRPAASGTPGEAHIPRTTIGRLRALASAAREGNVPDASVLAISLDEILSHADPKFLATLWKAWGKNKKRRANKPTPKKPEAAPAIVLGLGALSKNLLEVDTRLAQCASLLTEGIPDGSSHPAHCIAREAQLLLSHARARLGRSRRLLSPTGG